MNYPVANFCDSLYPIHNRTLKRLCARLIKQTLLDCHERPTKPELDGIRGWVNGDDAPWPFAKVCEVLELEEEKVRNRILREVERVEAIKARVANR